jgi:hypothetical protein
MEMPTEPPAIRPIQHFLTNGAGHSAGHLSVFEGTCHPPTTSAPYAARWSPELSCRARHPAVNQAVVPTLKPPPITIRRNRVPRITLIKRPAEQSSLRDAAMFLAGACTVVFVILIGVAVVVLHPFR